jgi:hypothetical protein
MSYSYWVIARGRPRRDSAAPACPAENHYPEVIQITRGMAELPGPPGNVRSVVSPGNCHNVGIACWKGRRRLDVT